MRSFGRAAASLVLLACASSAAAQTSAETDGAVSDAAVTEAAPPRSTAGVRYEALLEQDQVVLGSTAASAEDFRAVINGYWSLVRRYPSSGYADNALWQAGALASEAFRRFGEDRDKYRAVQLFQWLRDQYPHSPLRAKALEQIGHIQTAPAAAAAADTTIRAIHREVLREVVRVTVELDREVPFYQEQIDGPARLFFDLKGTKTVPSLVDATFRYDSDVVRHIRLGRHPDSTTRIVLDLENVKRYSVFTLYNPYRIVIDSERDSTIESPVVPELHRDTRSKPIAPKAVSSIPAVASTVTVDPKRPETPEVASPSSTPVATSKPLPPSANASGKFSVARQLGLGVSKIVLDPGHGGHDPGASAFGIAEAELVLDVTLRLEQLLQREPGIEVIVTRRTNAFLPLDERTEIANRESADLFLSIHANASANGTARGVETYFLNFALNPQAEAVAARENAASGKTMSSLPAIVKAITLNSKLNESRDFAASIQRALVRGLRTGNKALKDLGVKQAPFMVLIGASMPSVLAEISFVTNRQEARLLKSEGYRQRIAESLLAGILRYQQSLKKTQTAAVLK